MAWYAWSIFSKSSYSTESFVSRNDKNKGIIINLLVFDFKHLFQYFINLSPEHLQQQQLDSEIVREDYFEPYSQDGIDRFLDIVKW